MKVININSEYLAYVDSTDEEEWNNLIQLFRDASINQTWAYNSIRSKKNSTLILKHNDEVVAIAIIRLVVIFNLKLGIAYLGSGPLWRLKNKSDNLDTLQYFLMALSQEYVHSRKLYLRVSPYIYTVTPNFNDIINIFSKIGFISSPILNQTLFLNLDISEDELRKGLHQKWRNLLNRGEKYNFIIRIGIDEELFISFRKLYTEMLARKNYTHPIDIDEIDIIQSKLPENLKYTIIVCELENKPISGGIFSTIGNTGIYFLGATSDTGLRNSSSYVVQWEMIKWMKKNRLQLYDLGGCNPDKVPETYHFKAGICGKNHIVHKRIGIMDACVNPFSKLIFNLGLIGIKFLSLLKNLSL